MTKYLRFYLTCLCGVMLIGISSLQAQDIRKKDKYDHPRPKIGELAPDIMLTSPTGETIKLSDLKGQYVLIDFWAAWCAPCRKANRKLVKIYEKYQEQGFVIYSVSLDNSEEAWKQAIAIDGMFWEYQVREGKGFNGEVAIQYRIDYLPDNYLLDKTGKIIAVELTVNELDKILKEYMANR